MPNAASLNLPDASDALFSVISLILSSPIIISGANQYSKAFEAGVAAFPLYKANIVPKIAKIQTLFVPMMVMVMKATVDVGQHLNHRGPMNQSMATLPLCLNYERLNSYQFMRKVTNQMDAEAFESKMAYCQLIFAQ